MTTVATCNSHSHAALTQPQNKELQQHSMCRNPLFSAVFLIFCSFPLYQLSGLHFGKVAYARKTVLFRIILKHCLLVGYAVALLYLF